MSEWKHTAPPNETLVEVVCAGKIIRVQAIYGRDGERPHWQGEDGTEYDHSTFLVWREIEA